MKPAIKFMLGFAITLVSTYFLLDFIGNPYVISFVFASVVSVLLVKDND